MRIFASTILISTLIASCNPIHVLADPPPIGVPMELPFVITGNHAGAYTAPWVDYGEGNGGRYNYEGDGFDLSGEFLSEFEGTAYLTDYATSDVAQWSWSYDSGEWIFSTLEAGGVWAGSAVSVPEPAPSLSVIALFSMTLLARCRNTRLGYCRQRSHCSQPAWSLASSKA